MGQYHILVNGNMHGARVNASKILGYLQAHNLIMNLMD